MVSHAQISSLSLCVDTKVLDFEECS
jgi:hypothetical protein